MSEAEPPHYTMLAGYKGQSTHLRRLLSRRPTKEVQDQVGLGIEETSLFEDLPVALNVKQT